MEEALLHGATEAELAETLDIGLYMGGSLALKSVRYAFQIREALETRRGGRPGGRVRRESHRIAARLDKPGGAT